MRITFVPVRGSPLPVEVVQGQGTVTAPGAQNYVAYPLHRSAVAVHPEYHERDELR